MNTKRIAIVGSSKTGKSEFLQRVIEMPSVYMVEPSLTITFLTTFGFIGSEWHEYLCLDEALSQASRPDVILSMYNHAEPESHLAANRVKEHATLANIPVLVCANYMDLPYETDVDFRETDCFMSAISNADFACNQVALACLRAATGFHDMLFQSVP